MLVYGLICLALSILHLPSVFLLWKTPNGKIGVVLLLLAYFITAFLFTLFLPPGLGGDPLHWEIRHLWVFGAVLVFIVVSFLFAFAWKLYHAESKTPVTKKIFMVTGLLVVAMLIPFFLDRFFDFTPQADKIRRIICSLSIPALLYGLVFVTRKITASVKAKLYPSVLFGIVLLVLIFPLSIYINGRAAFLPQEKYFERKQYALLHTPDGKHDVYFFRKKHFYEDGTIDADGFLIYVSAPGNLTMEKVFDASGAIDETTLRISNDEIEFAYSFSYSSGGFFGIFGPSSVCRQHGSYSFVTGESRSGD